MIASIKKIFKGIAEKFRPTPKRNPWIDHYPAGVKWDAEIPIAPLTALLENAENTYPDHIAIDFLGKTLTYRELAQNARYFAAGLQKMGVGKGTRVGLFLPNSPHFVIAYYGILLSGATVVNFNPLYPVRDITHQIEDSGVAVMVTFAMKSLLGKLEACRAKITMPLLVAAQFTEALPFPKSVLFPFLKWKEVMPMPAGKGYESFARLLETPVKDFTPVEIDPLEDIALLQYTGGTTGLPKGAILTHANLYANAVQCGMWFHIMEAGKERILGVLPCFHVFAMTAIMNLSIHKGWTIILHPQFALKNVLKDIDRKRPTLMPGVPTIFNAINHYKNLKKYDLTSLKMCIAGGAGLPREVKKNFEALTGCTLIEGYGLSETSPVVAANPPAGVQKTGSIGVPMPQTVLEVMSMEEKSRPMPIGQVGEICIRGPQVMKGYWNKPEETEKALTKDGLFRTGDVGYMDAQGYFFIIDRLKEMIISGGYNIYPRNVEEVLYAHPAIAEAAVVGIDDPNWGQLVKAFVVIKQDQMLTEEELHTFVRDQLPRFAWPSEYEFRDALPKTLIGKISKKDL